MISNLDMEKMERLSIKENIYKYINVIYNIMETKPFSVTLSKDNVKKSKELIKPYGGKLSPILDHLLGEWIEKEEDKLKKEEEEDGNTK